MSRRARRAGTLLLVASGAALAAGCNAIFGITDVYLDTADAAGDGSAPGADGGADVTTTSDGTVDAPTKDAPGPDGRPPVDGGGARDADAAVDGGPDADLGDGGNDSGAPVFMDSVGPNGVIATDGVYLYASNTVAANNANIRKCPLSGCPVSGPALVVDGAGVDSVVALALANGVLYWANMSGSLHSCQLPSCTDNLFAAGQNGIVGILPVGNTLYWLNAGSNNDGAILSCPMMGCGASASSVATALKLPSSITTDGTKLFWTEVNGVSSCSAGSCDAGTLVPTTLTPDDVRYLGGSLTWGELGGATTRVRTCTTPSCAPASNVYVGGPAPVMAVVADATRVYFTLDTTPDAVTYPTGTLNSCPLSGCGSSMTTLASFSGRPGRRSLLLASSNLYWVSSDGSVFVAPVP